MCIHNLDQTPQESFSKAEPIHLFHTTVSTHGVQQFTSGGAGGEGGGLFMSLAFGVQDMIRLAVPFARKMKKRVKYHVSSLSLSCGPVPPISATRLPLL